jgi:ubiquinone/menaquinone biosynthesis C-methylase UbiE
MGDAPPATSFAREKQAIVESWDARAERWDAWTPIVDDWFAPATSRLLRELELKPGARVLELAAGTGGLTKHLAEAVGPGGHVLATDSGASMVRLGARHAAVAGRDNVTFRVMDGEHPDVAPGSFDAVACRQGFMFFAEPPTTLRRLHEGLAPGGRIGLTVFSTPDQNAFLTTPAEIHSKWADPDGAPAPRPGAPGPFSLGGPGQLAGLLKEAGFEEARSVEVPCALRMPSLEQLLRFYEEILGETVLELPSNDQEKAWAEVAEASRPYVAPGSGGAPCEILVVSGRRPLASEGSRAPRAGPDSLVG